MAHVSIFFTTYNGLTGILFVARKYRNESIVAYNSDGQLEKSREHDITKVKIPYFFRVTVRTSVGLTINGKYDVHSATTDYQPVKEPFPKEWDIVEVNPVEITFLNKCPKCGKAGRPRIDKKNKGNYHYPRYDSNQEEEYRLIYNHKGEGKKVKPCIIAKFDVKYGIFDKTGKISTEVKDYIFPNYLLPPRNI